MQSVVLESLVTEAQAPMFNQMLGTAEADFYGHQTKHGSFVFGGTLGLEDLFAASFFLLPGGMAHGT